MTENNNDSNSQTQNNIDRRDVLKWNNPHRKINHLRWYNPLLWMFVLIDIAIMTRWYWWHKKQSKKASRVNIATEITFGLQKCDLILNREDVDPQEEQYVKELRGNLEYIADELNLQSGNLERYIETGTNQEEQ